MTLLCLFCLSAAYGIGPKTAAAVEETIIALVSSSWSMLVVVVVVVCWAIIIINTWKMPAAGDEVFSCAVCTVECVNTNDKGSMLRFMRERLVDIQS